MADTIVRLYTTDHGHTIRAETYASDLGDASTVKVLFKNDADGTTAELTGTKPGDSNYSIDVIVTSGWLTAKEGTWTCQAQASWTNATLRGEPFKMVVEVPPT
jgi:hypothetical protein